MTPDVLITCEHGGNRIPKPYREYFVDAKADLDGHRGWDAGALPLARILSESLNAELISSETTRLLVDLNRSQGNPRHFSEYSRRMSREKREAIVTAYYVPYRTRVEAAIEAAVRKGKTVLHVSVHSFTPLLSGKVRRTDLGLLYDPKRDLESRFVSLWRRELAQRTRNDLTIHLNQPYRGTSDGFTTYLRKQYSSQRYMGIELEVSQKWLTAKRRISRKVETQVVESLTSAIQCW